MTALSGSNAAKALKTKKMKTVNLNLIKAITKLTFVLAAFTAFIVYTINFL